MRWTPWSCFGQVAVMSPHDEGTHLEWWVEGRGMRALSQILSDESLSYSLKHISTGEHSSHFMEEHSSPASIFPVFMMTSSNGNMFRVTGFSAGDWWLRGIHRSSVNSPHTGHWRGALMFPLNKRLSKQSRRRWFETPSCSLWRHCNVVPNSDPVIWAAVRSFGNLSLWCQIIHELFLIWGGNKRNTYTFL